MTTLTVSATTNFSGQNLIDIDTIDFTNTFTPATATFLASQFDDFQILTNVAIDGSGNINRIVVNGGSLDASGWTFTGWSGVDTIALNGTGGVDTITGSVQAESIVAGAGNDIIGGSLGADALNGGADIDTVTYAASNVGVTVDLEANTGAGGHAAGDTYAGIENVVGSNFNDDITGDTAVNFLQGGNLNDTLDGAGNNDVLDGGAGGDTLIGGSGDDVFLYGLGSIIAAGENIDGGIGTDDRIRNTSGGLANFLNVSITGVETLEFVSGAYFFTGSALGGSGIVNIIGSGGSDTIQVNAGPVVDLSALVFTDWAATAVIEILGGGAGDNTVVGSSERDTIQTSGGANSLQTGEGDDLFKVVSASQIVAGLTINGGAGALDEIQTFSTGLHDFSVINLSGVERLDFFAATASAHLLSQDVGAGGILFVDGSNLATDELIISGGSVDLTPVTFTRWSNSAKITISGSDVADVLTGANDGLETISGGGGGDLLSGRSGNDTLNGGTGADTMTGGAGDDLYFVDNAGDVIVEGVGQGALDKVATNVSYTLGAGIQVEIFTTTSSNGTSAINLTGNEFAQSITGNAGANTINAKAGADTMTGGKGNDLYFVDNAGDVVVEGTGQGTLDKVATNVSYVLAAGAQVEIFTTTSANGTSAINLTGNAFAQAITGNAGANVINGKAGNDTMTGGGGADFFAFDTALSASTNVDAITDFSVAADTIRLDNAIFLAVGANGTLASAAFFAGTAAHDASDRIIYNATTGDVLYDADGTGATGAIRFATLDTGLALTNADVVVI